MRYYLFPNIEDVSFELTACFVVGIYSVTGENAGG